MAEYRLLSVPWVLTIAVAVTGVAFVESLSGWPWAPFPLVHAVLAIAIPLVLGDARRLRRERRHGLTRHTAGLSASIVAFAVLFAGLVWAMLAALDRTNDRQWNILEAYGHVADFAIDRYGFAATLVLAYALLGIWPMFGEELFYRVFLFKRLGVSIGPIAATALSSGFFGLRHAVQLVFFLPDYPVVAGIVYFCWSGGVAVFWCVSYQRTGSIWPSVVTHSANLILAPVVFVIVLAARP
jgi:membrane protease YdiL (CAAX protease family)